MNTLVDAEVMNAWATFLTSLKELVIAAPIVGWILLWIIILILRRTTITLIWPDMPHRIWKDLLKKVNIEWKN